MKFLGIDLFALLTFVVIGYVVYRVYLNNRMKKRLNKVAYFSGGPLHATTERLAKYPKEYLYTYDKPRLVKLLEGHKPEPVQTWYDAHYEHQGDGVYEYQASTIHPGQPTYEVEKP